MNTSMTKNAFWVITIFLLGLFASCSNVNSDELASTLAEDLRLDVSLSESSDSDLTIASVLMLTLDSDVGIQFTEGQTLEITAQDENGDYLDNSSLAYDSNYLDLGERYVGNTTTPAIGDNYKIIYTDKDDTVTEAVVQSEGVPAISNVSSGATLNIGESYDIEWDSQSLGALTLAVVFTTTSGSERTNSESITDTGSYTLDLSDSDFATMAPGSGEIHLTHTTEIDSADGFGEANIDISSSYVVDVDFE